MPEVTGSGGSLGGAFREALRKVSLGQARPSYRAVSPRAQFRQLARTATGRRALERAGVGGNTRTRDAWLRGARSPNKANAAAIAQAHEAMRKGGIPSWVKRGDMEITGRVKTGRDVRDRGQPGQAPFRVDLGAGNESRISEGDPDRTHWDAIEEAIEGDADDDELEELLGDLIAEDVTPSDMWEFPGGSYGVTIFG